MINNLLSQSEKFNESFSDTFKYLSMIYIFIEKYEIYEDLNPLTVCMKHIEIMSNPQIIKELLIIRNFFVLNGHIDKVNSILKHRILNLNSDNFYELIFVTEKIMSFVTKYDSDEFKSKLPILDLLLDINYFKNNFREYDTIDRTYKYRQCQIYTKVKLLYLLPKLPIIDKIDTDDIFRLLNNINNDSDITKECTELMKAFNTVFIINPIFYYTYNLRLENIKYLLNNNCIISILKIFDEILNEIFVDQSYVKVTPILYEIIHNVLDNQNITIDSDVAIFTQYLNISITTTEYFNLENNKINNIELENLIIQFQCKSPLDKKRILHNLDFTLRDFFNIDIEYMNAYQVLWYVATIATILKENNFKIENYYSLNCAYETFISQPFELSNYVSI
jgi:hypothetical protein